MERIHPTPTLLVHGDRDAYFAAVHAQALHRASGGHAELWLEAGRGPAESAVSPQLVDRIVRWIDRQTGGNGAA